MIEQFVLQQNIKRFREMLGVERDETRRKRIEALLLEEQERLSVISKANSEKLRAEVAPASQAPRTESEAARQRLLDHARNCRQKAEELRAVASGMNNAAAAAPILRLARDYDLLADRAEERMSDQTEQGKTTAW